AAHQTGHNSGVIHAGVYYQPGSLKAEFCKRGAAATLDFCKKYNIAHRQCGKLLVATTDLEMERMAALEERCRENQIEIEPMTLGQLKKMEPNITGLGAFRVPATGITDYPAITRTMGELFQEAGGRILTGCRAQKIREAEDSIEIQTRDCQIRTRYLIACTGLAADRTAREMGIETDFSIVPFRGEYYRLPPALSKIVSHLIYPIPDPTLPFLGVHLTPMVDGCVTVGPNAVLGFKREGYGRFNVSIQDAVEMAAFPGFWKIILQHLGSGLMETVDSLWKPGYLKRVHKYCPQIQLQDLAPYPAGIRAQAVKRDGTMVHDFHFVRSGRSLHVCNAPSPAATSAIPIGEYLGDQAAEQFSL
ncbi:MAG: L-2-hydroxyglutarate oxidase, partial [Desulfobacterales bacterium]|nr:L-2-hydroxyglutarate oxidase [Desulfobacterales bacterium]